MTTKTIKFSELTKRNLENGDYLAGLYQGKNVMLQELNETGFTPIPWTLVQSTSQVVTPNQGYVSASNATCAFQLPPLFNTGDIFEFAGATAAGFTLIQNDNQQIVFGITKSTLGIMGGLTSSSQGDIVVLKGVVPNVSFIVVSSQGNINCF